MYEKCNLTTAEILKELAKEELILPTYTKPSYSNLGFSLIGRILAEDVEKTSFEEWTTNKFFSPMGMNSSGLIYTADVISKMAVGYSGGVPQPLFSFGWSSPSGEAFSSVNDMAKMVSFFTSQDKYNDVLGWNTRKEMLLPNWVYFFSSIFSFRFVTLKIS